MSDHDMRIGEPGEATPGSDTDPTLAEMGGPTVSGSTQAPLVGPPSMGDAPEDTPLGSPKGGASAGDTGPGRYGGDQDVPPGGDLAGSDRPYTTDASDVSRAGQARDAAHDIGGRWGTDEHGTAH